LKKRFQLATEGSY